MSPFHGRPGKHAPFIRMLQVASPVAIAHPQFCYLHANLRELQFVATSLGKGLVCSPN